MKNNVITLDQVNVKLLPELQGWRERQEEVVKSNPFVRIEDNKTYEEAKKRRTALVTARTAIQKQDKLIASKLKELRASAGDVAQDLISITQPHEEKQQDEVKRYEAKKEAERLEKERIERERKQAIQIGINSFYQEWKGVISQMTFDRIDVVKKELFDAIKEKDKDEMEEFEMDFSEKERLLMLHLEERADYLKDREEDRKERERLEAERKAFEEQKAKEEAERKVREDKERAEREAEAEKLRKEREAIEAEKERLAKEEEARRAKEEAEIKSKEEAERKAKEEARLKALQPDKEKLVSFIQSLDFTDDIPNVKDKASKVFLEEIIKDISLWKDRVSKEANELI